MFDEKLDKNDRPIWTPPRIIPLGHPSPLHTSLFWNQLGSLLVYLKTENDALKERVAQLEAERKT